jgi:anti-sigma factor RsiW
MTHSSNSERRPIAESDLHGYLDGDLAIERRVEVEAYLAAHPDQAARVAEYSELTLDLHRLFDDEETPVSPEIEALTDDLGRALRRRRSIRRLFAAVAAVVVIATGVSLATGMHDSFRQAEDRFQAFTQQATDAHLLFAGVTPATDDTEIDNDTTVVSWLSQRLTGVPVRAPDLRSLGYELTVERILPSADGPAAQLMYESAARETPVTLFIGKSRDKRQNAFTFVQNEDLSIFYWQEGPFAYSLAGKLERAELLTLAEAVDAQLTALPPVPKSMVQRRAGESTLAAEKTGPAERPVGAVPATVPESEATAADAIVKPLLKKVDSPGAGVATERVRSETPKVKPAAAPGRKKEPAASVVPAIPAEGETPKKT